jgi:Putative member of DMT superfamily (DUF486)
MGRGSTFMCKRWILPAPEFRKDIHARHLAVDPAGSDAVCLQRFHDIRLAQLKTMQEVVTLIVFAGFSVLYLKEPLGWNHTLGFALIALGAFFIFHKWS